MGEGLISSTSMINSNPSSRNRAPGQSGADVDHRADEVHSAQEIYGGQNMYTQVLSKSKIETHSASDVRNQHGSSWRSTGAAFGLIGGIASALMGALLTVIAWLSSDLSAAHALSHWGTILLCLTVPLILLGGYCLDLLDGSKPKPNRFDDDDDDE